MTNEQKRRLLDFDHRRAQRFGGGWVHDAKPFAGRRSLDSELVRATVRALRGCRYAAAAAHMLRLEQANDVMKERSRRPTITHIEPRKPADQRRAA